MINIDIQGMLPDFSKFKFTNAMDEISKHLELSIKTNFAEGGRPVKWEARKDGSPSYLAGNYVLFGTMGSESGEDFASAGAMSILPYSFVHQYGFDGVKSNGVYMRMPERRYVMFQDEDIEFAIKKVGGSIVEFWDTKGEQIRSNV